MIPVKQLYHVFRDAWQDEYEYLKEYGVFAANESWWLSGRGDWEGWHREFDKIEEDGMVVYYSQDRIVLRFTVSLGYTDRGRCRSGSEFKYLSIPREFADKALVLGGLPYG
jgi:hypothetical protein